LLAERLVLATDWVSARPTPEARHIGYFGASTGAAAALVAARFWFEDHLLGKKTSAVRARVFPSWNRRGGCAIKKKTASEAAQTDI
jgi:hypothetical protein